LKRLDCNDCGLPIYFVNVRLWENTDCSIIIQAGLLKLVATAALVRILHICLSKNTAFELTNASISTTLFC